MRFVLAFLALAVLLALPAACRGGGAGDEDATLAPPTSSAVREPAPPIVVTVVAGEPQGGVRRSTVRAGEIVVLQVSSDTADEVVVDGYDIRGPVRPGAAAELQFTPRTAGVVAVRLAGTGRTVAELEVVP